MAEYTTNQPIGNTNGSTPSHLNPPPQFSTGGNPPAHQGSKWQSEPKEIDWEPPKRNLEQQLCDVLINHTGEHGQNEGAVECLERIIRERDLLLKRAVESMLKPAHY